jgi:hypothetical protein
MRQIIISIVVGLCAAVYMHHISYKANTNVIGYSSGATWKLVIAVFIGVALFTYGVIAL